MLVGIRHCGVDLLPASNVAAIIDNRNISALFRTASDCGFWRILHKL
uniref:Uncharacterized protein n=1 Tax=Arundo donax TaxID=35708 RepID=A0A0A9EJ74_ARUDO